MVSGIDVNEIAKVLQKMISMQSSVNINVGLNDVNTALENTNAIIVNAANQCGMIKKRTPRKKHTYVRKRSQPAKPWFNESCETKRKSYFKARNQLNRRNDAENIQSVHVAGKEL